MEIGKWCSASIYKLIMSSNGFIGKFIYYNNDIHHVQNVNHIIEYPDFAIAIIQSLIGYAGLVMILQKRLTNQFLYFIFTSTIKHRMNKLKDLHSFFGKTNNLHVSLLIINYYSISLEIYQTLVLDMP